MDVTGTYGMVNALSTDSSQRAYVTDVYTLITDPNLNLKL